MACEQCVNRREFLSRAAATAGIGTLLAACGDGQINGVTQPVDYSGGPLVVAVASFPGLATVGEIVKVGPFQAVKRTAANAFDAFDMTCTHAACITVTNGTQFNCPCHGSRFSATGAVLRGPAASPLAQIPTSYDPATDQLTIG